VDWQARHRELADRQEVIIRVLGEIKAVLRNEAAAKSKAKALLNLMAEYVSRQDDGFDSALASRYPDDKSALKIIEFFKSDRKALKVKLFTFEDVHLTDRREIKGQWISDFQELEDNIILRFQMESAQLFPLLSKASSVAS
jgi:hypothetical protein